jgi:hypothetical protein
VEGDCFVDIDGSVDHHCLIFLFINRYYTSQQSLSGTPASSTTKTGRHDIAETLLKVALSTINQVNPYIPCSKNSQT